MVEHRHVNLEVAGSSPALINFSLFKSKIIEKLYPVSFPCGLLHDIYKKLYPFMVHPLLPVPRLYRNLGVIPGYRAVYGFMTSDWCPRTKILTK